MRDNGPPGFTWRERERKKQNEPTAKPIACIFHGRQQLEPFFWSVRVTKQAKDESSPPLAARLRQRFPTAKTQTLKRMVEAGRVIVNGRRATRLNQPTEPGDVVTVDERPDSARSPRKVKSARAMLAPLTLVHEDEDVLVIAKPAGLLTSTVPRELRPTALAIVRAYIAATAPRAQVGLIHRLDRDAGGLLVFSKNHETYESLKTQFFKHTTGRVYEAVVHGTPNPPAGQIESRLVERADGTIRSTDRHAHGQRAITKYERIGSLPGGWSNTPARRLPCSWPRSRTRWASKCPIDSISRPPSRR